MSQSLATRSSAVKISTSSGLAQEARASLSEWVIDCLELKKPLSARERSVLRLGMSGLRTKAIASLLSCSESTVLTHWQRIFHKSGLRSQCELLARLLEIALSERASAAAPAM